MTSEPVRPNLLLIGAARAATTAVAEALSRRSEVFMTTPKESHFWAHAGRPWVATGPGDDEMFNRHLETDPASYLDKYRDAGRCSLRGDGSVSTLYRPEVAIEAIRAHAAADVRLVCLLREPAARSHSAYLYLRSRGYEQHTEFGAALAAEQERIERGHHHMWHYDAMSRYGAQLPAFSAEFGDRLFVGVTEEIQADPVAFSRRLCAFLEIDPSPPLGLDISVNNGGVPRSEWAARVMRRARSVEPVRRAVLAAVPFAARERIRRANLAGGDNTDDLAALAALRRSFAPDVEAAERVLGRRIEAWHR